MKATYMKKAMSLIMAVIMLLSLVACGAENSSDGNKADDTSSEAAADNKTNETTVTDTSDSDTKTEEVKYKDRVVIGNASIISKVNPAGHNSETAGTVHCMTHNTLIGIDWENDNQAIPELAYEWEISPDNLVYTFKLEEGVKFHDGSDFTAEDVIFTIEEAKKSSYQESKLVDIAEMKALDDYTLEITLSQPNSDMLFNLGSAYLSVICQEALEKDPDLGYMVGTGAYVFTEWVPDDYAHLTRNENYWGEMPETKEFIFRKYSEASARVIALQTGEIDICLNLPAAEVAHVVDDENLTMLNIPNTQLTYIGLNTKSPNNPALADVKVRQAINYAINRAEVAVVMHEDYAIVPDSIIPASLWGYAGVPTYEYDVEKAKSLLEEAGYPDGIEFSLVSKSTYPNLFEVLQSQLAKANITLTLATEDNSVRTEILNDKAHDSVAVAWIFANINSDLRAMFYGGSGSNRTMIDDPYVNETLDQALIEADAEKNLQSYKELTQYLTDQALIVPLYLDPLLVGMNKNVEGAVFHGNTRHEFTYVTVAE